ncbi:unnamed protein product [Allacma fusca]|uniref:Kelch-like protein diablo n=1 Tax=Allacma fusca TaxID=39272 RepID=A0A8J2KYF1_9HEXA|nr:unnamed protein product [Allacma fusca]
MSSRWSKNQYVGDCQTCLCRITHQRSRPISQSEEDYSPNTGELCDSQMSSQLLSMLKSMRDDESLCDVTLCIGKSSIKYPAHKVVLAAASPYFRKMFSCGLKETQDGEVQFHDIQPETLLAVINFIYTGKIQIDETIVDGLLDAADLIQLPSLRNLCLWWLATNLTPSSCLGVYVLALLRLHLDLAESAKDYAIEHFREVSEGEEFLHLSPEYVAVFLDSPYLGCDDNGQLLKALVEWTNFDENRRTYLKTFLSRISLLEIVPQVLIEVIQHPVVLSNPEAGKILQDTLQTVLSKKFDSDSELELPTEVSVPVRCFYQQDVLFAIGGESQGQSLSNVECFMMGYDGWKCSIPRPSFNSEYSEMEIIPTMKQCRYYPAIAYDQYSLYVLGGQDCGFPLDIVERYDILENRWETLAPLPISVHGCGATIVSCKLYLVGGRSSKHERRVWAYDRKSDSWYESVPMKSHRVHVAVSGFNGELYAVGGIGGANENDESYMSSVEKFDPMTNAWTTLAPMHEERAFHSVAVVDCFIYAMGGCNGKMWLRAVEKFDTMCGQWSKVCNMSVPRSSFGTTVSNGRIYCCGGYDGTNFLNTVEKYNPRTDRWHCAHSMQIERYGLALAAMSIPLRSHISTPDYS